MNNITSVIVDSSSSSLLLADEEYENELYDDINDSVISAQNQQLKDLLDTARNKNSSILAESLELKNQISALLQEKNQVERNMVSLYNTAMTEISRKDREILDLRQKLHQESLIKR